MSELSTLKIRVDDARERIQRACALAGRDPGSVLLCAASKTQSAETVALAAGLAIDIFGENRVQELTAKHAAGAYGDTPLHFIGHLQTNKVKQVVGKAHLIQSADSEKLLLAIHHEAEKQGLVQPVLLEVNIGAEQGKSGVLPQGLPALAELCAGLCGLQVKGLMCVPPRTADPDAQRRAFERLRLLAQDLSDRHLEGISMQHLSMGMSGDFESAILEGSTIVRLGTALFGPRNYGNA